MNLRIAIQRSKQNDLQKMYGIQSKNPTVATSSPPTPDAQGGWTV